MLELRCPGNRVHGIHDSDTGTLEVRCKSIFCGHKPGVVVIHRIVLETGAFTTQRYKEPPHPTKEGEQ